MLNLKTCWIWGFQLSPIDGSPILLRIGNTCGIKEQHVFGRVVLMIFDGLTRDQFDGSDSKLNERC